MLRNNKTRSYQSVGLDPTDSSDDEMSVDDKGRISNLDDFDFYAHSLRDNILSHFNLFGARGSSPSAMIKYYLIVVLAVVVLLMTISGIASHFSAPPLLPTMDAVDYSAWSDDGNCNDGGYFKFTLKEEYTQSIGGMLKHSPNAPKFEASGVVYDSSRDAYWVVFDSLWSIAMLTSDLTRNDENMLIDSDQNSGDDDSGFEGIYNVQYVMPNPNRFPNSDSIQNDKNAFLVSLLDQS